MNRRWLALLVTFLFADVLLIVWWRDRREHKFDREILSAARRYELPPSLVKAVVWRESGFNSQARGKAGEIGLMQLMELSAQEWADDQRVTNFSHEHAFDAATNTLAGCYYLAKALKRYPQTDNPWPYALADYNAGRANVVKWMRGHGATNSAVFLQQIDFPGTREYVRSVLRRYAHYQAGFE
jgi:soluble lytic murein transglycosylase